LIEGAGAPPTVLKPNLFELWQLDRGQTLATAEERAEPADRDEVLAAARRLQAGGIAMVVVSLGAQGVVGLDRGGRMWEAHVTLDRPPVDAVGSGDALGAGLTLALARGAPFAEALRLGVACGAANTLVAGAGRCRREDVERLARRASVVQIA
jgi:fructose-1-phosphate kinase PfkB-like protein